MIGSQWLERFHTCREYKNFDCGNEALNHYLRRWVPVNQASGATTNIAVVNSGRVVGYVSLSGCFVQHDEASYLSKCVDPKPVFLPIIEALAVDKNFQGKGIGSGLLKNALRRHLLLNHSFRVPAVIAVARDEKARGFFTQFNMIECPSNPLHLYILMKDLKRSLQF